MILTKIIEEKRKELDYAKSKIPQKKLLGKLRSIKSARKPHFFKHSISVHKRMHLIAEVKKASPSAGLIRKDFDPLKIAALYEANGASAVSILTDKKFFQGRLSHLEEIRKNTSIALLRKDFIIDEYQVYESIAAGADAILLIADLLSEEEIKYFLNIGGENSIDFLVETHSEEDVKKAISAGCEIIGINNRDLHTFKVDINTTARLIKMIPEGKIIVSESGIKTKEDISYLRSLGVNAVLIGETFMRSGDIGRKVRELTAW
ncbi:MAG: indole-3-glycerol phosphate synthase TrpC [Candidatus Omnitrophota bacterium]|nr:indole-3-glycerol phosphate synthase TrpC [Candidatus Omnitrophota bacterium]